MPIRYLYNICLLRQKVSVEVNCNICGIRRLDLRITVKESTHEGSWNISAHEAAIDSLTRRNPPLLANSKNYLPISGE
jgi:hypothetical protein